MKLSFLAAILMFAGAGTAMADTCKQDFIRLMSDRTTKEPTKILLTQQIKGGAKTINWNYQDGKGNWLTEMVEPANAQMVHGAE